MNMASTMIVATARLISTLATKYASGGIGATRFRRIQPCPRSTATDTPNPNRAAPMTPNAP